MHRLLPSVLLLALPLSAQVRMIATPAIVRITGPGWTLQYGTGRTWFRVAPQFLLVPGDRAWFSHGPRLRLIDTKEGNVIGRWLFPDEISALTESSTGIDVEIQERRFGPRENVLRHSFHFDPQHPAVPYWPSPPLFWGSPSPCEPRFFVRSLGATGCPKELSNLPSEHIAQALPLLEDMVRRDPLSPWFGMVLGQLLRANGDPRASQVFDQAAQTPGADFIDLLSMAELLERLGETEAASTAFEAGFRDFLAHGHDPRLFVFMGGSEVLYSSNGRKLTTASQKRTHLERLYRLAPAAEGGALAWDQYARIAGREGDSQEARLWRTRAAEARASSLFVKEPAATERVDTPLQVALAATLGALLLLGACSAKYFQQRTRASRPTTGAREFRFLLTEYWTWPERSAFLFLTLCAWLTLGVAGGYFRGLLRLESIPYGARFGSFAGPQNAAYFENELPASPEKQILVGLTKSPTSTARNIPTPEQMERALGLRVSPARAFLWGVGGPITAASFLSLASPFYYSHSQPIQAAVFLLCLLLPLALFILLVPRMEAIHWDRAWKVWEALVPGASSAWSWLGGIVLLAFSFFLVEDALVFLHGKACFVAWTCGPYTEQFLRGHYGLDEIVLAEPKPGPLWLYGAPLAIWIANLICMYLRGASSRTRFQPGQFRGQPVQPR